MRQLLLSQIAQWTHGQLHGPNRAVGMVGHDSRQILDQGLYVAIRGERYDGHAFCQAAIAQGAVAVLVSQHNQHLTVPQIIVPDTIKALAQLAMRMQESRPAKVLAITGSNGKTSVKSLLQVMLQMHCRRQNSTVYASPGNHNNEIGLPLAVIDTPEDTSYAIYEMGAGKPGDIDYLTHVVRPDIALVNNIAPAHLERLHNVCNVAHTKGAIYQALSPAGTAIINSDDAFGLWFEQTCVPASAQVLRFGLDSSADVTAKDIRHTPEQTRFTLLSPWGNTAVVSSLLGRHNVSNAIAAAAMAGAAGVCLADICLALAQVQPVPQRLTPHRLLNQVCLIDDTYNANTQSCAAAIATLGLVPPAWFVLGDMHELGPHAPECHTQVGEMAHQAGVQRFYGLGPLSAYAAAAFGSNSWTGDDPTLLVERLWRDMQLEISKQPCHLLTILVKGSRASAMDHVVEALIQHARSHVHVA